MPYYIRLFSKSAQDIAVEQLRAILPSDLSVRVERGTEANWHELTMSSSDSREICTVERSLRDRDDIAAAEIQEYFEALEDAEPRMAADWIKSYLNSCQTIYTCQFLNAAFEDAFGDVPSAVMWCIRSVVGGIGQADGEGFDNEAGYHATWDFSDNVTGSWKMAILVDSDRWRHFEMDLGNAAHRKAFRAGQVPSGVPIIE